MRKGRHRVCAALVETGIDEGHRDDAQERVAISGDGSGPVESLGLSGGYGARVGAWGGRWIKTPRFSACGDNKVVLTAPKAAIHPSIADVYRALKFGEQKI